MDNKVNGRYNHNRDEYFITKFLSVFLVHNTPFSSLKILWAAGNKEL